MTHVQNHPGLQIIICLQNKNDDIGFSIATLLHNHDTYLIPDIFLYSERNPTAISQQPPASHNLGSTAYLYGSALPEISLK